MTMKNTEIIAKYGIEEGTRRIEENRAKSRGYNKKYRSTPEGRAKNREYSRKFFQSPEGKAYHKAYYAENLETIKAYQKTYHASPDGKVAHAKSNAKRTEQGGLGKKIDNLALKACCEFFGMKRKEFMAYRKAIGYTFHHAFGNSRPDEGVFLPKYAHDALHSIYGRGNENVTIDRLVDYCTIHNIRFIVISKCPLLPYHG